MTTSRLWQIRWSTRTSASDSGVATRTELEIEPTTVRLTDGSEARILSPVSVTLRPSHDAPVSDFTMARLRLNVSTQAREGVLRLSLHRVDPQVSAQADVFSSIHPDSAAKISAVIADCPALEFPLDSTPGKRTSGSAWQIKVRMAQETATGPTGVSSFASSATSASLNHELRIELVPEIKPLSLIHDIEEPFCRSINLLGNFDACFSDTTAVNKWHPSNDGALLHRSAALAVTLGSSCRVQLFENDRCIRDGEAPSPAGMLTLPLSVLPHGDHVVTVRATATEDPERSEVVRVEVKAEQATFANLPVARRFIKGIDVADGHLVHSVADCSIKAPGLPLEFVRTYCNLGAESRTAFPMGYGWTHNYHSWAERLDSNYVFIVGGEGSGKPYRSSLPGETGNGMAGYHGSLVEVGGAFELTTPTGIVYRYGAKTPVAGRLYLEGVRDPNGNQVKLSYNARGLLERVTDASGSRHLRFTYHDSAVGNATMPLLVAVEAYDGNTPLGLRVEFAYAGGHLTKAQRAARIQTYTYSVADGRSPHRLLAATDADGGTTRYTYKAVDANPDPLTRLELERVVGRRRAGWADDPV